MGQKKAPSWLIKCKITCPVSPDHGGCARHARLGIFSCLSNSNKILLFSALASYTLGLNFQAMCSNWPLKNVMSAGQAENQTKKRGLSLLYAYGKHLERYRWRIRYPAIFVGS
jgi:hypothetical protein